MDNPQTTFWEKLFRKKSVAPLVVAPLVVAPLVKDPKPTPITFCADDIIIMRAEKIWYGMGFCHDHGGMIPKMAGFLSMYKEWDDAKR